MLIKLTKLHAKALREVRKVDKNGSVLSITYNSDLMNHDNDSGFAMKGMTSRQAEDFGLGLVAGKEYDVSIEVSEHVEEEDAQLSLIDRNGAPAAEEPKVMVGYGQDAGSAGDEDEEE